MLEKLIFLSFSAALMSTFTALLAHDTFTRITKHGIHKVKKDIAIFLFLAFYFMYTTVQLFKAIIAIVAYHNATPLMTMGALSLCIACASGCWMYLQKREPV